MRWLFFATSLLALACGLSGRAHADEVLDAAKRFFDGSVDPEDATREVVAAERREERKAAEQERKEAVARKRTGQGPATRRAAPASALPTKARTNAEAAAMRAAAKSRQPSASSRRRQYPSVFQIQAAMFARAMPPGHPVVIPARIRR